MAKSKFQPKVVEIWDGLQDSEKLQHLLKLSLSRKKEILSMSATLALDNEELGVYKLILAASDSTINQVLQLQANTLRAQPQTDDIEELLEARRRKALEAIKKLG